MPKAKPPPDPVVEPQGDPPPSGDPAAAAAGTPIDLNADIIRATPEYQALLKQNRQLARDAGRLKTEAEKAREAAERNRLAAEATQQASIEQEIQAILGEEGVAFWAEFAELSQSDPREAAKRLAAFRQAQAQSQPPPAPAGGSAPPPQEEPPVPSGQTPPAGIRAVGEAPLGNQRSDDPAQLIASLEATFNETVKRNQDPATRNRVTMRERGAAMISYLLGSYLKAGAKPKTDRS